MRQYRYTLKKYTWEIPMGRKEDKESYLAAAKREFEEETGLKVIGAPRPLIPKNPRKYFKCRRGEEYHDWQIFEVRWRGELKLNQDEIKNTKWCSQRDIEALSTKTADYLGRRGQAELVQEELTLAIWRDLDKEWETNHGLEPVWYEFFKELKIIP